MNRRRQWQAQALWAWACAAALALGGGGAGSGWGQEGPVGPEEAGRAEGPDLTTASTPQLVEQVLRHPKDQGPWEELRKPQRRGEAKKLLLAALENPARALGETDPFNRTPLERHAILESIAGIFEDDAAEVLVKAVKDRDWEVRQSAVQMLGSRVKVSTDATRKALREATRDSDSDVVNAAMKSLRARPDPEAGPLALAALRKVPPLDPKVLENPSRMTSGDFAGYFPREGHIDAIDALGATSFVGGIGDLLALARDPSAFVRTHAARALAHCAVDADAAAGQRVVTQLREMLEDPNHGVRLEAALALAEMKDPAGTAVLLFEMKHQTRPMEGEEDRENIQLLEIVQAMEKLTGEDLGGARGAGFWFVFARDRDSFERRMETVQPAIQKIVARAAAHGFATEGAPKLPAALTEADKALFERGFKNWLVDPKGGTYIEFQRQVRARDGSLDSESQKGWLFPAAGGRPARVLLEDQAVLPAPEEWKAVDLAAEARAMIAGYRAGKEPRANLIEAAWLYRLGQEELAAQALFLARGAGDQADGNLDTPGQDLAWRAFDEAMNAFIARADEEALADVQRLAKLYPKYIDKFGPGTALLADLQRRQKEGTFGRPAPELPEDFDQWPVEKRLARLIQDLQELDIGAGDRPSLSMMERSVTVQKLIALGDAAVPALIECVASDKRLTRLELRWYRSSERRLIEVSDGAQAAITAILRVRQFEPIPVEHASTQGAGKEKEKTLAELMRAYWAEYGKLPLDQRLMKVLTNEKSSGYAMLDTASLLANFSTWRGIEGVPEEKPGPNPVLARYQHPTVAEAILAARDRHMKTLASKKDAADESRNVDKAYARALSELGDASILPELKRRFAAEAAGEMKLRWAMVCFNLKDEQPLRELAESFLAGTIVLPRNDAAQKYVLAQPGNLVLIDYVRALISVQRPYADEALAALAPAGHPYHAAALDISLYLLDHRYQVDDWFEHPFFVRLLRPLLDDTQTIDGTFAAKNEVMAYKAKEDWSLERLPRILALAPPDSLLAVAFSRGCDAAAGALPDHLLGMPEYHPLLKDRDARLAEMRAYVDKYGKRLRPLTSQERNSLEQWQTAFVPSFEPLQRHATARDVAAGRAVFSLTGRRTPTFEPLPATGRLVDDLGNSRAPRVLIVQAERDEAGDVHYGIVEAHRIREVLAREIMDVVPVGK